MWQVVLHNDDYTPVEFVVQLLQIVFRKSPDEAYSIAMFVHQKGRATVGLYTKEVAETKVDLSLRTAAANGHPLLTTAEQA